MAIRPRYQSQLGRGPCPNDGKTDCNVRAHQMAFAWATNNNWVPGVRFMRQRMGRECDEPTNLYDAQDALRSVGIPVWKNINQPWARAIDALKKGKPVVVSMKYSVLNSRQPNKSGDPNFTGAHGIMLLDTRKRGDGKRLVLSWDALYDGRRKSIPKGPQWVLASTMKAAGVTFARKWGGGDGRNEAWFNIISKKQNAAAMRRLGDVGYGDIEDDETEVVIDDVEAQRNDLIALASDVDFLDAIIENPQMPAELRVEAEAQRAITRAAIPLPEVDPWLETGQGIDLPDADDLTDDEEEEFVASISDEDEE